jgi:hypothetical protein
VTIDHHEYMAGAGATLAPGARTAEELAVGKASVLGRERRTVIG